MTGQLHLLRGFPPNINGAPITLEEFVASVPGWAAEGNIFGSWTRRRPRREAELEGGSVYFVLKGETRFRMPLLGLERVGDGNWHDVEPKYVNHTAICCAAEIIWVERFPVRYLRGWRYLASGDAPPDLPAAIPGDNDLPEDMKRELKELGL